MREPLPTRVDATPELPPGYDAALTAGLRRLGLTLGADARAAIDGHIRLLLAWTTAINLTAVRDPVAAAAVHVLDSLTAVPHLRAWSIDRFLDLGAGGGLPGIPLAAAVPGREVLLVEPTGKKARFLETALAATGLDTQVAVANERSEVLAMETGHRGRWPAVTARAVGSMAELVELAFPLLADGGWLVAWKRGDLAAELDAGDRAIRAGGGGRMEVITLDEPALPGHVLVVVTRDGRVPDDWPRDPAVRKRRPW